MKSSISNGAPSATRTRRLGVLALGLFSAQATPSAQATGLTGRLASTRQAHRFDDASLLDWVAHYENEFRIPFVVHPGVWDLSDAETRLRNVAMSTQPMAQTLDVIARLLPLRWRAHGGKVVLLPAVRKRRVDASLHRLPVANIEGRVPLRLVKVRRGDSISSIAERELGRSQVERVVWLNRDLDPHALLVGSEVLVPAFGRDGTLNPQRAVPWQLARVLDGFRIYAVKAGDRLDEIARRELGSKSAAQTIRRLNAQVDFTDLVPGFELFLPTLALRPGERSSYSLSFRPRERAHERAKFRGGNSVSLCREAIDPRESRGFVEAPATDRGAASWEGARRWSQEYGKALAGVASLRKSLTKFANEVQVAKQPAQQELSALGERMLISMRRIESMRDALRLKVRELVLVEARVVLGENSAMPSASAERRALLRFFAGLLAR